MSQPPWGQPQQQYPPQQQGQQQYAQPQQPPWGAPPQQQQWGPPPGQQQQGPPVQVPDAESFFDGIGGSGAPSYNWGEVGDVVRGTVDSTYPTVVTDLKGNTLFYPVKRPGEQPRARPQLNITLQTELRNWEKVNAVPTDPATNQPLPASEDTGLRRIYCKYDMRTAIGMALKAAGVPEGVGVVNGARLAVRLKDFKPPSQPGNNPLPLYEAMYAPPAVSNSPGFDFGPGAEQQQTSLQAGVPGQQQAPAQQQYQQPMQQPQQVQQQRAFDPATLIPTPQGQQFPPQQQPQGPPPPPQQQYAPPAAPIDPFGGQQQGQQQAPPYDPPPF